MCLRLWVAATAVECRSISVASRSSRATAAPGATSDIGGKSPLLHQAHSGKTPAPAFPSPTMRNTKLSPERTTSPQRSSASRTTRTSMTDAKGKRWARRFLRTTQRLGPELGCSISPLNLSSSPRGKLAILIEPNQHATATFF